MARRLSSKQVEALNANDWSQSRLRAPLGKLEHQTFELVNGMTITLEGEPGQSRFTYSLDGGGTRIEPRTAMRELRRYELVRRFEEEDRRILFRIETQEDRNHAFKSAVAEMENEVTRLLLDQSLTFNDTGGSLVQAKIHEIARLSMMQK